MAASLMAELMAASLTAVSLMAVSLMATGLARAARLRWRRVAFRLVALTILTASSAGAATTPAAPVILIYGDSLSAEYGLARGSGWAALLDARLKEKRIAFDVANASISGETTSGGATRIAAALQQHQPAIVIIELGGNDGLRGLALDATRANLARMISVSQKRGARVVLAGMQLPPNYGRSYTAGFHALYADLARQHQAALVPFFLAGVADNRALFQSDGIHPTQAAQIHLLDNVWPVLAPLLASKVAPKSKAGGAAR